MSPASTPPLLDAADPPAIEMINPTALAPVLFVCDHAAARVPRALNSLDLDAAELARHIAWDIGAADLTRSLAGRFGATAILTGYSRLVIDCNRAPDDPTSMPEISDGTVVPGNRNLTRPDIAARIAALFDPFHAAVRTSLARISQPGRVPALISVHSFTPVFRGEVRPWHVGILWDKDPRLAVPLLAALGREAGLCVGDNQPYSGRDRYGYTIVTHGAAAGLPHVLLEVRQDLIDTHRGVEEWAERFQRVLHPILADPKLHRSERF
jgi:predicted N-formylglutamate amidohydrolase